MLLGGPLGRRWRSSALGTAAHGLLLGLTRPWRLADQTAGPGARLLAWLLPAVILVLSRGAFSNWLSWSYLLATLGSIALFTGSVRLLLRGRDGFALFAGSVPLLLLKTLVLSAVVVVRGPMLYWYRFWTDDQWRTVYVTISFAVFLWLFWVTYLVLRSAYGWGRLAALGRVLVGVAVPMVALGALMMWSGLESALTTFNDQMALLPLGLSRIPRDHRAPGDTDRDPFLPGDSRCWTRGDRVRAGCSTHALRGSGCAVGRNQQAGDDQARHTGNDQRPAARIRRPADRSPVPRSGWCRRRPPCTTT